MGRLTWTKEVIGKRFDDNFGNELIAVYREYICPVCGETKHTLHINGVIVSGGYATTGEGESCVPCAIRILDKDYKP